MKKRYFGILVLTIILFISLVNAIDQSREERLDFGYVLEVKNVSTNPVNIIPGRVGQLTIVMKNKAKFPIYDIRAKVILPTQILFFEDISTRKIWKMDPGEEVAIGYNIIAQPSAAEGIYNANFNINYINHVATEREENDSFGIIIKSEPQIISMIEKSGINNQQAIGDVSIKFVNNNIANLKFLTVTLLDSPDYQILSNNKEYIGDLDSDDFQSVTFKIKSYKSSGEINLPIILEYQDSLNKPYNEKSNLALKIRDVKDLEVSKNYNNYIIVAVVIIVIIIYIFYRGSLKRKEKNKKL